MYSVQTNVAYGNVICPILSELMLHTKMFIVRTYVTHANMMLRVRTYDTHKMYNVRTYVLHKYEIWSVRTNVT